MAWTIIVASSEADQLDELMRGAQEIANRINLGGTVVMDATCIEEVVRKRQRRRDGGPQLLIVAASLPNVESSPNPQAQLGLGLIQSVAQEAAPPACILVSDQPEHYQIVQVIERCELLAVNACTNYIAQCLQLARKLGVSSLDPVSVARDDSQAHASAPETVPRVPSPPLADNPVPNTPASSSFEPSARPPQHSDGSTTYALLEVELPRQAEHATFKLEIRKPEGTSRWPSRVLNLKQMAVDELIRDSLSIRDKLVNALDWKADYRALGERLANLFPNYFWRFYGQAYGESNGNVRLRFTLERSLFDGLW
jgi:hypothetical protein